MTAATLVAVLVQETDKDGGTRSPRIAVAFVAWRGPSKWFPAGRRGGVSTLAPTAHDGRHRPVRRTRLLALAALCAAPVCQGCGRPWEADDPWAVRVTSVRPYELCAEALEDFRYYNVHARDTLCLVDFDGSTDWDSLNLEVGDCAAMKKGKADDRQFEPGPDWSGSPPKLMEETDDVWVVHHTSIRVEANDDCPR